MIQNFIKKIKDFLSAKNENKQEIPGLNKDAIKNEENVDMTNVIHSMFLAETLYDQLKVQCHPDRFVHDKELVKISTDIFQRISENRRNLKMLKIIKDEAVNHLKIEA